MTSFLPDDLKIEMKERLRDVRFIAREMRPLAPRAETANTPQSGPPAPGFAGLTQTISELSETAFHKLESVAIGFLSSDPQSHFVEARAYPFERYRRTAGGSGKVLFARDCYFAAKWILHAKGVSNPRVSEAMFASANGLATVEWARSSAGGETRQDRSLDAISREAAIISSAIFQARPVQAPLYFETESTGKAVNTGVYVACAIGLAMAVADYHRELLADGDTIYGGVCAAVDTRYDMFEQAIVKADRKALVRILGDLIPHLP